MTESSRSSLVLAELRALRRHPSGATIETLALAPTTCHLLGAGDPYLAYVRLQHGLIDARADRPLRAAAASLGFSTIGDTHLKRLDEAGHELGLDQRQVRRLSDQGLAVLATLISTNWTVEAVPELTAIIRCGPSEFMVGITTLRPLVVEMSEPDFELFKGDSREILVCDWQRTSTDDFEYVSARAPLLIPRSRFETSLAIVWRGELWPKFTVHWYGDFSSATSETLGNKVMLRLVPPPVA